MHIAPLTVYNRKSITTFTIHIGRKDDEVNGITKKLSCPRP